MAERTAADGTAAPAAEPPTGEASGSSRRLRVKLAPIWWSTIGLFILSWILQPDSVNSTAIDAMLPFAGILAVASIGQTLVVMSRGVDLSVAGTMTLAALIGSKYATGQGGNLWVGFLIVAAVAVVIGLVNGVVVAYAEVTPLVATFALNTLLVGVALFYSGGRPVRAPESLADFALSKTMGVSNTVLVSLVFVVIVGFATSRTVWGRQLMSVGSSERAAQAVGLHANRVKVSAYVAGALCFSAAGVLLAGYVSTPNVGSGNRYLLPSIAAVVVGGNSFVGGRGYIVGTAAGALFLSQLSQLVLSLGLPTSAQLLIEAAVIAVAIGAQTLDAAGLARRTGARLRASPGNDTTKT